jgi:ATP-dependent RNA helicase RhlE
MEAEGEAITFVSSEEENDLHGIEKILGKKIPRVTLPDFDYKALPPPKVRGREGGRPPRDSRGGGGQRRWRRGPPHR